LKRIRLLLFALFFSLIFGACGPGSRTAEPEIISPTAISLPIDVPVAYVESNHCLDCHSDKQELIDTAKPEEVVESESSGAG
jgi:hypothetical protein